LDNLWRSELLCAKNKEMQKWRMFFPHLSYFSSFTRMDVEIPLGCLSYLCCTSFS
jgi:hypothetical protein